MTRHSMPMKGAARSSKICPFIPGDDASDRHARRMDTAVSMVEEVRAELNQRDPDLVLKVCSPGHWQIRDGKTILAQWWPESGRFVPGEEYNRARKCHDVRQMLAAFGKVLAER